MGVQASWGVPVQEARLTDRAWGPPEGVLGLLVLSRTVHEEHLFGVRAEPTVQTDELRGPPLGVAPRTLGGVRRVVVRLSKLSDLSLELNAFMFLDEMELCPYRRRAH